MGLAFGVCRRPKVDAGKGMSYHIMFATCCDTSWLQLFMTCCLLCVLPALRSGAVGIRKRGLSEPYPPLPCARLPAAGGKMPVPWGFVPGGVAGAYPHRNFKSSPLRRLAVVTGGGERKALVKLQSASLGGTTLGYETAVAHVCARGNLGIACFCARTPPQNRPSVNCRNCCTGPSAGR